MLYRRIMQTQRLVMRPWIVEDAGFHRELWTERDPRVPAHRRIDAEGHPTILELKEWIRTDASEAPVQLLVVERKGIPGPLGYCGLITNPALPDGEPEIAYEFLARYWGSGYATEAAGAFVDLARTAGYPRLWATVRDWNAASLRVLEKLGFTESGRVDRDAVHGDSLHLTREL